MEKRSEWLNWEDIPVGSKVTIKGWSTYTYTKKDGKRGLRAYVVGGLGLSHSAIPEDYRYKLLSPPKPPKPYFTGFKRERRTV